MEGIPKFNGQGNDVEKQRSGDPTEGLDISPINDTLSIDDIQRKITEIFNKNIKLLKYHKGKLRERNNLKNEYNQKLREIELTLIEENKTKPYKDRLNKDQLKVQIRSKIPNNILENLDKVDNEIAICELTLKNHNLTSDLIRNYNISDSTRRKHLSSNRL